MKTLKSISIATLTVCILQSPANAGSLNAEQVQSLMVGKRIDWVSHNSEWKGSSRYKANGTSTVTVTAPEKFKDRGTWRIEGNKFCSKWKKIRDGAERCSTIRTTTKAGLFKTDTVFLRAN